METSKLESKQELSSTTEPEPNPAPEPVPAPAPELTEDDKKQAICDNATEFIQYINDTFKRTAVREDYTIFVFFSPNERYRGMLKEYQNSDIEGPGTGRSTFPQDGYQLNEDFEGLNRNENALTRISIGPGPVLIGETLNNAAAELEKIDCNEEECLCTFRDTTTKSTNLVPQEQRAVGKTG